MMAYLQVSNVTNLPYIRVNEYDIKYKHTKCNIMTDIRKYGYIEPIRVGDIFEIHDWTKLMQMPYKTMDSYYFDKYDIIMMKQNNAHIFAKMAYDINMGADTFDIDIDIETPEHCIFSDEQFNKIINTRLFHFPAKCMQQFKSNFSALCRDLGGVAESNKYNNVIVGILIGIFTGGPILIFVTFFIVLISYIIITRCREYFANYDDYDILDDEES